MSLIDDIKRDREAGTPGRWVVPDQTWSTKLTVEVEDGPSIPCKGTGGAMSYTDTVCTLDWRGSALWNANARRIARVPDMEQQILADADRIEALTADNERLQARVAELEEALRIIANHRRDSHTYDDDAGYQPRVFDEEDVRLLEQQARAALKETGHD